MCIIFYVRYPTGDAGYYIWLTDANILNQDSLTDIEYIIIVRLPVKSYMQPTDILS